tara:strand:+ start:787 stop:1104 length:318 start_codon:yes stop_codon:yes gene_type:complete
MTAPAAPTVKDQEQISSGLVESASVNSISDFIPSKLNQKKVIARKKTNEFINTFICHLIFYGIFCISLVLHVLFDLGLGSFIRKTFIMLIESAKNIFVERNPAFA